MFIIKRAVPQLYGLGSPGPSVAGIGTAPITATQPLAASLPQTVLVKGIVGSPPFGGMGRNASVTEVPAPGGEPDQPAVECALRVVLPVNPTKKLVSCARVRASVIPKFWLGTAEPPVMK